MFSAHLIFGDIDKHSSVPFPRRREQLEIFWKACERFKPQQIDENRHSFYDVDNDCIMVGLSDVVGFTDGVAVLKWVIRLQAELAREQLPVSFGVNLIACGQPIEWLTYPGFMNRTDMLYIPDWIYEKYGHAQRSRLAGDGLIVVSRLLELAKKVPVNIAFSAFQGGHLYRGAQAISEDPELREYVRVRKITSQFERLASEKRKWLEDRKIEAWGILSTGF